MNRRHLGSAFDDWLDEEGIRADVEAVARRRLRRWLALRVVLGVIVAGALLFVAGAVGWALADSPSLEVVDSNIGDLVLWPLDAGPGGR